MAYPSTFVPVSFGYAIQNNIIRIYMKLNLYSIILANQAMGFDNRLSDSVIDVFDKPITCMNH